MKKLDWLNPRFAGRWLLLSGALFLNLLPLWSQAAPGGGGQGGGGGGGGQGQGGGGQAGPIPPGEVRVLVKDFPENLERIERLLEQFDRAPLQVLTQVYIVQLDNNFERRLGLDWKGVLTRVSTTNPEAEAGTALAADAPNFFRYGNLNTEHFEVLLKALETKDKARVIAKPILMTISGRTSNILIGSRVPYVTFTINSQTNVQVPTVNFIDIGIGMTISPTIYSDGNIRLNIRPEVSVQTGTEPTQNIPIISTTRADTDVIVKDNSSIIIGGLINKNMQNTQKNLPYTRKIPVLNALFGGTTKVHRDSEVTVIIHAKIINTNDSLPATIANAQLGMK